METLCRTRELEREADQVIEVEVEEEEEDEEEIADDDDGVPEDTEEVKSKDEESSECPKKTKAWEPSVYTALSREQYYFAGHDIDIREALDSYGAIIWPGAIALCQYLEMNPQAINLMDKSVLEIGAGTGLLSIVACLLGAWVTATDMPDILGNLTCNLRRNTRGRCRYTPQVAALCWEQDLESTYPRSVHQYNYVLAADVVYHHDFLDELLVTMRHFCQPGTTLIWSNKVRFQSDLRFTENFKSAFHTTLLAELPDQEIKIFMATSRE
ncbi:protein-lysine methyltransferase METTL21C isoform X2 [Conger conger]|nr:protein-lysine methyltransferase METTL21C isoform X2 [Conger conger]XP_061082130.1 protein-lysine methyltransferase METTL21C isoform X2 [Conger conger]XP_061082131.1 protein-lysine methyltransferase METTL21C isoform X2 [Conger conger]XP_061082132.1 protein-lysine methyltransferase METTL21C isoform X2 [Conger conger]